MPSGYTIPAPLTGRLRIGTCSWKYDSWKGLIYDPDRRYRPDDYLPDYARHFTTVEVDQWFSSLFPIGVRLPGAGVVRRYADCAPGKPAYTKGRFRSRLTQMVITAAAIVSLPLMRLDIDQESNAHNKATNPRELATARKAAMPLIVWGSAGVAMDRILTALWPIICHATDACSTCVSSHL